MPPLRSVLAWGCLALPVVAAPSFAADFLVTTAAEITAAQAVAQPGDTITMADGVWNNQVITFSKSGTADNPITLRAQTPGRVILTGSSRLTISASHTVTTGLTFKDGALTAGSRVVRLTSTASYSRFTNSAIIDYDPASRSTDYDWVAVDGLENRVDHNFFKGKNNAGVTIEVTPSIGSKHRIDNNHFADRPLGTGNGWETIRLGVSSIQTRSAQALVERNLFERVDGEIEIISNKTSDNIIRNNTIRASNGTITLRHGSGSLVEGNYFMGENRAGSRGIRVIGPNHVIVNNHLQDLDLPAISLTTGLSDFNLGANANTYEPVDNVLLAHNTLINVTDGVIRRDADYNQTATQTVRPANLKIVNNILWSTHQTLLQGTEGPNWTYAGNVAFGASVGKTDPGIVVTNPQLAKDAKGVWRPMSGSPVIDAGASGPGTLPSFDIDGQPRTLPRDIGADEFSSVPASAGPLSGSDVGPSWLNRRSIGVGAVPVPVILFEAEDYTAVRDPNGDNDTWTGAADASASGGYSLIAPPGSRVDLPGTHDAIVEYDLAFHDPGTYYLYVLARGLTTSSDSLYVPATLGADPSVAVNLPLGSSWTWLEVASYNVLAGDVNRPVTLQLGKREAGAQIDRLMLSPVQLNPAALIPDPSPALLALALPALLLRRRPAP